MHGRDSNHSPGRTGFNYARKIIFNYAVEIMFSYALVMLRLFVQLIDPPVRGVRLRAKSQS